MKKQIVCLSVMRAFLLSFLLLTSVALWAGSPTANESAKASVAQNVANQAAEKRNMTLLEATAALRETENALGALDKGKKKDALKSLEIATGKLELILARDPKLALAPTGVSVTTQQILASPDEVKKARKAAQKLLDDGDVQEARRLLSSLASETIISVTNIPLATYPAAIKDAVRLIDQEKVEEAKRVLQTAMSTLAITNTVIPLPVVDAQQILKTAESLAEKKERKAEDNEQLSKLLKEARTQLEFAQVLGYGKKKDFKDLYAQLDEIEKNTDDGKSGTGFFAKIKTSISELLKSNQVAQDTSPSGPTSTKR
jgi:hypothetical protein